MSNDKLEYYIAWMETPDGYFIVGVKDKFYNAQQLCKEFHTSNTGNDFDGDFNWKDVSKKARNELHLAFKTDLIFLAEVDDDAYYICRYV